MAVTTERMPRSLVALEIEVDQERLESEMERAVRRLSQQLKIPGFRPGKAPRAVVERTVGRPAVLQEAIEELIPHVYNEAIEAEQLQPVGQPDIDLKSVEPLVVRATVPVRPTVDLGDYPSLRIPRDEVLLSPSESEAALLALRRQFATLEPVDRPVEWGDTVRVDVTVSVEGQAEPHVEEGAEFPVREGSVISLPGFLDHLIGLERGGPHHFEFKLPDDYHAAELAGKTASYDVTVREIKEEALPDLDDDFARSLDEDAIENVEQLKTRIEENVQARRQAEADAAYRDEAVDVLLANATIEYPEVLVEREIDQLIDERSNHASHTREGLERWLEAVGQSESELRDGLRELADVSVRRSLVVSEFANREGIAVADEEIAAEVERLTGQLLANAPEATGEQRQELLGRLDTPELRNSIRAQLLSRAALGRLVEIVSQPEDEEGAPRARGTRRRRRSSPDAGEAGADDNEAITPDESEQPEE